jgi:hypothetical protein
MQLCQKEYTNGRASRLPGEPSSHDTAKRIVGPITRIARYPTHVIRDNKNRCHRVKRPGAAVA